MNLTDVFDKNTVDIATWPKWMRKAAGFDDSTLTPEQRKKAAAILRCRADELEEVT